MTQMGDISSAQVSDVGSTQQDHPTTDNTGITGGPLLSQGEPRVIPEHAPCTQPQQPPAVSEHAFTAQFDMSQLPMGARPGPYNMAPMANALPPVTFRPGQYPHATQQRYNPTSPPPMMQQMPQFAGHPSVSITGQGYYLQQPQMAQYYGNHMPQPQVASSIPSRQNMAYYPNQMVMSPQQSTYYYPHTSQYQTSAHPVPTAIMAGHYYGGNPGANDPRAMQPGQTPEVGEVHPQPLKYGQGTPGKQSAVSSELKHGPDGAERRQSAVRGPPRKPRQSGHAIWIGNLPPQTDLMNLVHHVCKETLGLESLFLISKSNCAFANFKDEESCTAAQQKLHDSKFESVRLVSRLRKSTVEGAAGVTAPTGPAVVVTTPKPDQVPDSTPTQNGNPSPATESMVVSSGPPRDTIPQKDKFFILKSLTVEDLELSVRTGIWATQSHNEDTLNNAFKAADSVYLVFSANKSGEYFGYARMVSQINEDPEAAIEFAPTTQAASDLDLPKAIPTEATEHAPKGRIIDDSARGTIFWEAEREDSEGISDVESDISSSKSNGGEESTAKTWGKPFKLEWLSTSRLPFYRTRGLRNPWNSNREVKIARDGTELEPSVGRRLIGLFNRIQSPGPIHAGMRMPLAAIPGFPPMRPYGQ